MGNTFIMNRYKADPNLKLEAQRITDFSGNHEDWQNWKSRTECAFSGSGYERVLEEEVFSERNPKLSKVVYSQLAAATVDGSSYHLVRKFEKKKDGYGAWMALCDWYDGDTVISESAENLRVKLDNWKLHSGITASDYINKFLAWYRDLEKIEGEGLTDRHAIYLFLKNIVDPEYVTQVAFCRNTKAELDECIASIRRQERDLQQKRIERKTFKSMLRRARIDGEDSDDSDEPPPKKKHRTKIRRVESKSASTDNDKFEGELTTTERGLLRFSSDCWKKMDDKNKEFVREYNAAVKHGEPSSKVTMPKGISVKAKIRRQSTEEAESDTTKKPSKKKKGVSFGISDDDHARNEDTM